MQAAKNKASKKSVKEIPFDLQSFASMAEAIKAGLSPDYLDNIQDMIGITRAELARRVNIPKSTIDRRVREKKRLSSEETERVLRIYRLFDIASQTLGGKDKAKSWLNSPNTALGGLSPMDYADTEPGAREVENLLGRILYGVYS